MIDLALPTLNRLESLADLSPELALARAVPTLAGLAAEPRLLEVARDRSLHSLAPVLTEGTQAGEPYASYRYDGANGAYSLQVFVWPPGSRTPVHDHSCWGAFCCLVGALREDRYERLDNSRRPNYARLRRIWWRIWQMGGGISTLLPYAGGIHRVGNPADQPAISLHLYGPLGRIDGRDYDPRRDYVCDRLE
jgi:hypothetical protein